MSHPGSSRFGHAREESPPAVRFLIVMKRWAAPFLVLSLCAGAASGTPDPPARPADWATPVSGTCVKNLYLIEDGFYRGSQPTAQGFQELQDLGVKTVLDLAGGGGDSVYVPGGPLKLVHIPMTAFELRDDRVLEALRVMVDPANRPLMIHCKQGADRTGALVALYRIVVQGWSKQKAVLEMSTGGFHHSALWRNLDYYVMKADVDALRRELKLSVPPAKP